MINHSRQFSPIIAPLMLDRPVVLGLAGVVFLQGMSVWYGLSGWPCPILHGLGIPCPGCGLSRAIFALAEGDWSRAMTLHAFAPVVLLAIVLIVGGGILPKGRRLALAEVVAAFERRTGLTSLMLIGLLIYWAARLVLMPTLFIQLLKG
jgi:hypothetical protein